MESDARYTLVGAAILALVVAAVGAVVWLKGAGPREEFDRYTIYFQRQPLDGLQIGADVTMLGVSVGRVEGYSIDPDKNRVNVTVRVLARTPVGQTTTAIVQRNLVTGIARIALVTPLDEPPGPPRVAVAPGEAYPVIPEGKSEFDLIANAANRMVGAGVVALDNLNDVLSPDNRAAFGQTLANVRDITAALNRRMDQVDASIDALNRTVAEVGRASREIGESLRQIQIAASPALAQAEASLREVTQAAARLERQTLAVADRLEAVIDVGALELASTTRDIRASAEVVARTFDRLRDARTALFGPAEGQLGPGERLK